MKFVIMEFIYTQRNKRKLIRNGFMYVFQKELSDGQQSWECVNRRGSKSRSGVKLDPHDNFVESVNEHSCIPSQQMREVAAVKSAIKRRAENTNDTTQQILAGELVTISPAASAILPSLSNMRRTIRSQRQMNENLPPLPPSRADIPVLPAEFQTTISGHQFLLYDSGVADVNRILIFGSPDAVTLLEQSADWFGDHRL